MMRRVLAISGKRFAGKDTLAAMVARRGGDASLHAFAAESKRMFAAATPTVDLGRLLVERAYKELWRPQLTEFTVAALRADPQVFCRAVVGRIEASPQRAVITDLRLRLEVEFLRARFELVVVRVTRPDAQRAASGWRYVPAVDEHATETQLDDPSLWDDEVVNDGTLEALDAVVDTRISGWLASAGPPRSGR